MVEGWTDPVEETAAERAWAILSSAQKSGVKVEEIPELRRRIEAELASDDVFPDTAAAVRSVMNGTFQEAVARAQSSDSKRRSG